MSEASKPEWQEYYDYLDGLRESGTKNMFSAGAYLREEFGLTVAQSREVLSAWMKEFCQIDAASK